jgi:hypothetical protein
MNFDNNSVAEMFERARRKAPEYLDLLSSKTDAEFEAAFTPLLERAVSHLEANAKNFRTLDEVGLSGVLAGVLMMPGLTVTQESHSNGHVDLTIVADHSAPTLKKLAEAKIYRSPSYHIEGVSQLLNRYTTGREGSGFIISYIRKKDISGITTKVRAVMDAKLPESQIGPCENHELKWSFRSKHKHKSGEVLSLGHVGCNLMFD